MFPFVYSPTFEYPLSGNVMQTISPMFGEIEGIPEVEHEVVTTVASYGKQLGKLTEAVLVLAEEAGVKGAEIDAVRELAVAVDAAASVLAVFSASVVLRLVLQLWLSTMTMKLALLLHSLCFNIL